MRRDGFHTDEDGRLGLRLWEALTVYVAASCSIENWLSDLESSLTEDDANQCHDSREVKQIFFPVVWSGEQEQEKSRIRGWSELSSFHFISSSRSNSQNAMESLDLSWRLFSAVHNLSLRDLRLIGFSSGWWCYRCFFSRGRKMKTVTY
jgi:hypothetical protein